MVNYIKLAWMLRTDKTCNPTIEFSNYDFYNKSLGGVTLLRVTPGVNLTQFVYTYTHTHIYIYIYINNFVHI